jgi:hypothetical protein
MASKFWLLNSDSFFNRIATLLFKFLGLDRLKNLKHQMIFAITTAIVYWRCVCFTGFLFSSLTLK